MSKDKISQYSTTNALNTDIGGIDIDENCLPSNLNDSVREVMVQLKEFQDGSSADSFTTANIIATGGSVNGTTVGDSTASTGAFTSLTSTNDATLSGVHVGKGAGAVGANTALGSGDLNYNTTGNYITASGGVTSCPLPFEKTV